MAFLLPLVLVPVVALLVSTRQPALYEASAQVLFSRQDLATQLEGLTDANAADPARTAQTQAQLARVPHVARRALKRAELDRDPSDLLGASSVTPTPETDLLVFRVRDADSDVAALLANAYAQAFTTYRRELESDILESARARVQNQMEALKARGEGDSAAYDSLLEKDQQLLTMEALQTGRAVVVRAAAGTTQIRPQPRRAVSIGLVLGLVLGLALAFLYEALDSRVRTAQEVAARLRLPLLGRIPPPPRQARERKQLVMLSAPYSKGAEAFRILRSNVEFALERAAPKRPRNPARRPSSRPARVLMVTSAQAADDKSTTTANLAVAFADAGQRTVLVDFNMRNARKGSAFGLEGQPEATDAVSGAKGLDQAMIRGTSAQGDLLLPTVDGVADDRLRVYRPSGAGDSPADSDAIRGHPETLRSLSEGADIVLIDAPPLLVDGNAIALTAHVDSIIVVTRANSVGAATLEELRRVLDVAPAAKLGFVLTGSKDISGYPDGGYEPSASDFTSPRHPGSGIDAQWKTESAAMVTRERYRGV